ncbi:MAG TPA: matrixin family metalloprotease [Polyangiaceae bacterium]
MTRDSGKGCAVLCLGFLLPSCGIYDAIWGNEAHQKRVAEQRAPAALRREGTVPHDAGAARRLRVRVYATPRYATATVNWQHQFDQVVGDANPTLRADLGVELEVVEYLVWSDAGSEDSLPDVLQRLALRDSGHDVDWVIALATAVPELAESPDQIGLATTPGKHLVIRAMSDPEEFDAIERGFPDLARSDREKLYASRKRHKAAIVELHELGHTLGIPHETAKDSLMNARYSPHASAFSSEAIRIAKAELARRYGASTAPAAQASSSSAASVQPAPATTVPAAALEGLSNEERRIFQAALAQKDANNLSDAWRIATPLFGRHESVYVVQKLRCDLATAIGGAWESIKKECEPFMKLPTPP